MTLLRQLAHMVDDVIPGDGLLGGAERRPACGRTATCPSVSSCSPTISATSAPERSAAFICARMPLLVERPVSSQAGAPQLGGQVDAPRAPPTTSTTNTSTRRAGAGNTPSASQVSSTRSMPAPKPDARRRRPAELLDQAVVAAAAEHRRLRVVERARTRTRTWCGCSSRSPRTSRGSSANGMPIASRPLCTRSKCAAALVGQVVDDAGRVSVTSLVAGRLLSSTRIGWVSTRSPVVGVEITPTLGQPRPQHIDVGGAGRPALPIELTSRSTRRRPSASRNSQPRAITSTSTSGSLSRAPRRRPGGAGGTDRPGGARTGSPGVAYQTFHGVSGRCWTNARTTEAVPSGRSATCRPPLSSKSYISLRTTSAPSALAG